MINLSPLLFQTNGCWMPDFAANAFLNVFLISFSEGKSDLSEIPGWLEFIECLANDVYKMDLHKNRCEIRLNKIGF